MYKALGLFLFLVAGFQTSAQLPPTEYFSKSDGSFGNATRWSVKKGTATGMSTSVECGLSENAIYYIEHDLTSDCNSLQVYGKSKLIIRKGGSLKLTGGLEVYGDAQVVIDSSSSLLIRDDLNIAGNAQVQLNGDLSCTGNIDVAGAASGCGKGTAYVSGVISGHNWCYDISVVPQQPLNLSASLNDDQSVSLTWSENETSSEKVRVERSFNGMTFKQVAVVAHGTTYIDKELKSGQTYYYRLSKTHHGASCVVSEIIAVSVFDSDEEGLCTLEVEPNPCVPFCEARILDCPNGNFKTQIYDASGNVITELIPHFESNDLIKYHINKDNFLQPGTYIVTSGNDKTRLSKKVIVK